VSQPEDYRKKITCAAHPAALHGINRNHAIFGWSDSCVATNPSDLVVALAAMDTLGNSDGRRLPWPGTIFTAVSELILVLISILGYGTIWIPPATDPPAGRSGSSLFSTAAGASIFAQTRADTDSR
jgi:hypothetical protein